MMTTGFALRERPHLSARCLRQAPELASLAILEETLHVCLLALYTEHPTLDFFPEPPEPPSLRRARRLLSAVHTLQGALDRYYASVYDAIGYQPLPALPPLPPLDSPF